MRKYQARRHAGVADRAKERGELDLTRVLEMKAEGADIEAMMGEGMRMSLLKEEVRGL